MSSDKSAAKVLCDSLNIKDGEDLEYGKTKGIFTQKYFNYIVIIGSNFSKCHFL